MTTGRSIRSRRWRDSSLYRGVLLASFLAATSCEDEGEPGPYCDWVEEEVPLDYSFGSQIEDMPYDLQPGEVLERLTVPLRGTLTWNGGGDWAEMTPNEGMTTFSSSLIYGGTTVFRRVPGATGDRSLACPYTLDFDASIRLSTEDGVLDEIWETTVSYDIIGDFAEADIDAEAVELPETLQVMPNPDPPIPVHNLSYSMLLSYNVYPLNPELPTSTSGRFYLLGNFEVEQQDDEYMELAGIHRLLVEWMGFEGE